jgi:hypothetical protein
MYLFTALFRNPARVRTGRTRLAVERLECRDLPSSSPVLPNVGSDLVYQIANAEFAQDGALARTDVIDLFSTVAGADRAVFDQGKVSFGPVAKPNWSTPLSAQYIADLQSIVQNSAQWGMTPDIADLAEKVVGYNQANEHYHGKPLLANGAIAADDKAGVLHALVDKWFYGTDLPQVGYSVYYKKAAGMLFGPNGPQATDVAEGWAADCYFLANLGEAAQQSPQTVENMIINNGDNTCTVRFFEYDSATRTSTPDYVTVNSYLPVNSKGEFVYANYMFGGHQTNIANPDNVLWVALVEKAYAQLAEEGWSRANWSPLDDANAYASIKLGNNRIAGRQITGNSDAVWVGILDGTAAQASATMNTLAADFQKGDLLTICTDDRKMTDSQLDANHVYLVTAINIQKDRQDDTVTLLNPYTTRGPRTVTVTLKELAENAAAAAVVDC